MTIHRLNQTGFRHGLSTIQRRRSEADLTADEQDVRSEQITRQVHRRRLESRRRAICSEMSSPVEMLLRNMGAFAGRQVTQSEAQLSDECDLFS